MNEAEKFLYFIKKSKFAIDTLNETSSIKFKKHFINIIVEKTDHFERPDIVIYNSNKSYLLEHYEFDSSKLKKWSSIEYEKIAELNRDLDKMMLESKESSITVSRTIENEASTESFINNLMRNTNNHIEKYNNYLMNFNENKREHYSDNIEFGFVIENTSAMTDMIYRNNKPYVISPFDVKEFVTFLKMHENVKHIFYLYRTPDAYRVLYFYNDKSCIDKLIDDAEFITKNNKLLFSNPQSISGIALLKK